MFISAHKYFGVLVSNKSRLTVHCIQHQNFITRYKQDTFHNNVLLHLFLHKTALAFK